MRDDLNGVYVLELSDGKYYVGSCSRDSNCHGMFTRIINHLDPLNFNTNPAKFVEENEIKRVDNIIPLRSTDREEIEKIEDEITALYMLKYGYDNVRGGHYCHGNFKRNPDAVRELIFKHGL